MTDYVSREVVVDAIENADADVCQQYPDDYCSFGYSLKNIKSVLAKIPAADVEQKQYVVIQRVRIDDYYGPWGFCPACGYEENTASASFCGGCGARLIWRNKSER